MFCQRVCDLKYLYLYQLRVTLATGSSSSAFLLRILGYSDIPWILLQKRKNNAICYFLIRAGIAFEYAGLVHLAKIRTVLGCIPIASLYLFPPREFALHDFHSARVTTSSNFQDTAAFPRA